MPSTGRALTLTLPVLLELFGHSLKQVLTDKGRYLDRDG
jgi:hypothetical protein